MTLDPVAPFLTLSLLNAISENIPPFPHYYDTSNLLWPEETWEETLGKKSQGGMRD